MPGLPARPRPWPAPTSTSGPDSPSTLRGTPHESLKRSRTNRSSDGIHSHSVMEACDDAHPAPPVDLGRHAEEGDHGGLDHPGVDGGHHQLTRVLAHHVAYGARGPCHELRPALATRRDGHGGVLVPVGHPEGLDHLAPLHAVGFAGMQLAEITALPHRAEGRRSGPDHGPQPFGRLGRPGQHRGVQGGRLTQLAALVEPVRQRRHLMASHGGQARAALDASDDPVQVALRLAVAHQHNPGGALFGREDAQHARLGAFVSPGAAALDLAAVLGSRQVPHEVLQLAQRPALHHVVAVGRVLPDDGVARAPVVAWLGVEPVDVARPGLQVLDHP